MDNDTVIRLEGVSVVYRLPRERLSGLKEYTIRFLQRRLEYHEFWALREVSFEIRRGEVFGVIGRNGAGKSTLLKVIAKVLYPTQGRVVIRGKVAPLLEIGAGFQPELTGRENVFLNSILLGRSHKETERLLPEILDFAELEDFIDAPLRTYSTGMVARLGFSVATCARPEILLVDEVLSVGDAQFQQKCLDRMYSFLDQGTTVVIVSHGMGTIESFCDRAMWLNNGQVEAYGQAGDVANRYVERYRTQPDVNHSTVPVNPPMPENSPQLETPPQPETPPILIEPEATPALLLPAIPEGPSVPTWSEAHDYIVYPDGEGIYPAAGALNIQHGSVAVWVRFRTDQHLWGGMIFHSDDSRYVIYTGGDYPESGEPPIPLVTARAGGNRRTIDTFYGTTNFPEVNARLGEAGSERDAPAERDTPTESGAPAKRGDRVRSRSPERKGGQEGYTITFNEWHLLCMVWEGYPEGRVHLYVDGKLMGETTYDRRNDNRYRLASQIAIGYRPREWLGELVQDEDGTLVDLRPPTTASVAGNGMEMHDLRLYQRKLTEGEIQNLLAEKP